MLSLLRQLINGYIPYCTGFLARTFHAERPVNSRGLKGENVSDEKLIDCKLCCFFARRLLENKLAGASMLNHPLVLPPEAAGQGM